MFKYITTENYKNLDDLLNKYPKITTFLLKKGNYEINKPFVINRDNIRILSENNDPSEVHIFQKSPDLDGIVINANNVILRGISIHVEEGENVCLAHFDSNWTKIHNCYFYGSDTHFTVFFSGPSQLIQGESTLNGYDNDILDRYNIFEYNVIYTIWSGDAISFSLQKYGSFRGNIMRGGKMAIYMCKDCYVTHNIIYDSTSNGIITSLPSYNIKILHNEIMYAYEGGIVMRPQLEHGNYDNDNDSTLVESNIIVNGKYIGIEIENGSHVTVRNNIIKNTENAGIYCLNCEKSNFINNLISHKRRGIILDNSINNTVEENKIYSIFDNNTDHAILLINSTNNIINKNIFYGDYTSIYVNEISSNNIISNNESAEKNIQYPDFDLI